MKWSKSSFGNVVAGHRKSRLPSENTIAGENNLTFPAMKISTLVFCTSSYKNLAVFSVQKNRTSKHGVHNALKVSKSGSQWIQLKKCDACRLSAPLLRPPIVCLKADACLPGETLLPSSTFMRFISKFLCPPFLESIMYQSCTAAIASNKSCIQTFLFIALCKAA